jgi:ribosomal protein L27
VNELKSAGGKVNGRDSAANRFQKYQIDSLIYEREEILLKLKGKNSSKHPGLVTMQQLVNYQNK